ncbi:MAG: DUF4326 domain-containing protein [Patescibacteria group bacterium]|nr:DUF4326 domain-containing protein [Patescibacteria group bacterium]
MIKIGNKKHGAEGEYVGRPTALGNRFTHRATGTIAEVVVGSRHEAVQRYREEFVQLLTRSRAAKAQFDMLLQRAEQGDITLVCWCAPEECHAEVIKHYLELGLEGE